MYPDLWGLFATPFDLLPLLALILICVGGVAFILRDR
jgi:hypothetical protein